MLALLAFATPLHAEQFMASLTRADWKLDRSPIACRLKQSVPRLGEAVFEALAGGDRSFALKASASSLIEGPATMVAIAPPWNPTRTPVPLGDVTIAEGAQALRLEAAEAQRLLDTLESGLVPQFSQPLQPGHSVVGLSPLNFRPAYRDYQDCIRQMLPVSFEDIASTTLVFARERSELTPEAQQKIDAMLRYVKADRSVTSLSVMAVSADTPRRLDNLYLAKERAEQVQQYLLSRGIAAARISSDWRGERSGSGAPRSVTISLRRAD